MTQTPAYCSQFGEDEFVVTHVKRLPKQGVFVDVGAGDPVRFSNSYHFEQLGWTGLCIDADPKQVEALTQSRDCEVEWAAVGLTSGEVQLLQSENPDFSTTLDHLPTVAEARGWEYAPISVPAMPLEALVEKHGIQGIDLLTIDTEGTELDVCKSLDWEKHRPETVIVEFLTWGRPSQEMAVRDYFATMPYRLIHRTRSNLVFWESGFRRGSIGGCSAMRALLARVDRWRLPPSELDQ